MAEALAKGSFYWYSPRDLVLVANPTHELYDARVHEPPDPALVESLSSWGNRNSVKVQRAATYTDEHGKVHENVLLVAAGRRRVIAARTIQATQDKDFRLKCEHVKGPSIEEMAIENSNRKAENPAEMARKARQFANRGRRPHEIASLFGVDAVTVSNWLALADAPEELQTAVQSGDVSANVAYQLARAGDAETVKEIVKEAKASGKKLKGSTGKAAATKVKAKKGKAKATPMDTSTDRRLSAAALRKMLEVFTPGESDDASDSVCDIVKATLEFILGVDPKATGLAAYKDSVAAKLAKKIRSE